MACRSGCGACCEAPSIATPIPGHPHGKPAGVRCWQLDDAHRCRLFGLAERPALCGAFRPGEELCGNSRDEALDRITRLELATTP